MTVPDDLAHTRLYDVVSAALVNLWDRREFDPVLYDIDLADELAEDVVDRLLAEDDLPAHLASVVSRRDADLRAKTLDAVLARADDGNEFGPASYLLLRRIVADVRRALDGDTREDTSYCLACQTGGDAGRAMSHTHARWRRPADTDTRRGS